MEKSSSVSDLKNNFSFGTLSRVELQLQDAACATYASSRLHTLFTILQTGKDVININLIKFVFLIIKA